MFQSCSIMISRNTKSKNLTSESNHLPRMSVPKFQTIKAFYSNFLTYMDHDKNHNHVQLYINGKLIQQKDQRMPLDLGKEEPIAYFEDVEELYKAHREKDMFLYVNYKTIEMRENLKRWDVISVFAILILAFAIDFFWMRRK